MKKLLLLGDEAIAQAALDAGLSGMYAYPGTPSTEIMEYIQASPDASEVMFTGNGRRTKRLPWKLLLECLMQVKGQWWP